MLFFVVSIRPTNFTLSRPVGLHAVSSRALNVTTVPQFQFFLLTFLNLPFLCKRVAVAFNRFGCSCDRILALRLSASSLYNCKFQQVKKRDVQSDSLKI